MSGLSSLAMLALLGEEARFLFAYSGLMGERLAKAQDANVDRFNVFFLLFNNDVFVEGRGAPCNQSVDEKNWRQLLSIQRETINFWGVLEREPANGV